MSIKIVENKYLNALLLLMLFSAIIHMLVVFYWSVISKDFYLLNYFNILDLDLFYPNIFNNFSGNLFSLFFVVVIYILILKINRRSIVE